jgi:hypothetical protein
VDAELGVAISAVAQEFQTGRGINSDPDILKKVSVSAPKVGVAPVVSNAAASTTTQAAGTAEPKKSASIAKQEVEQPLRPEAGTLQQQVGENMELGDGTPRWVGVWASLT